jgi:sugar/nucleoside kinase (ribokinase family)
MGVMPNPAGSDVVVVGNVGIDTKVFLPPSAVLDDILREEGQFASDLDYVGQAGGFTSRGFARLGVRTSFIGHVGADPLGEWVRAELAADGVDLTGLGVDPTGTARSVNLMAADGSRINFYDGRGHLDLTVDPADAAGVFAGTSLALFHLPNWARHLLPAARAAGAVVACDLQDVRDPDDEYRRDFVRGADVLFVSAAHFDAAHFDAAHFDAAHFDAAHFDDRRAGPTLLLDHLMAAGHARMVLCGRGRHGVLVATADGIESFPPPPVDLPIVDTNGAGDALAVGFLAAHVLQGRPVAEAVLRGQLGARWTCTQRASSSALITPEQLDELLARTKAGSAG